MCMCEVCYDAESRRETGVWGPDLRDHHRKSTKVRKKEVGLGWLLSEACLWSICHGKYSTNMPLTTTSLQPTSFFLTFVDLR